MKSNAPSKAAVMAAYTLSIIQVGMTDREKDLGKLATSELTPSA